MLVVLFAALAFPGYEERWFNQTLDHFRYVLPRATFQQRYLFNDTNWGRATTAGGGGGGGGGGGDGLANGCPGPILFYTGNEGPITGFWGATGFLSEVLAPAWGGLLVHAEERYYGASQPFASGVPGEPPSAAASFATPARAAFLTTEQVLADYVQVLTD